MDIIHEQTSHKEEERFGKGNVGFPIIRNGVPHNQKCMNQEENFKSVLFKTEFLFLRQHLTRLKKIFKIFLNGFFKEKFIYLRQCEQE